MPISYIKNQPSLPLAYFFYPNAPKVRNGSEYHIMDERKNKNEILSHILKTNRSCSFLWIKFTTNQGFQSGIVCFYPFTIYK